MKGVVLLYVSARESRLKTANDDSAKALCKLNNTKKTRNPEIDFEFEKYFSNSN